MTTGRAPRRRAAKVVVVGAGSCGSVLAARLSQDAECSVLLLEAGPDYPDPGAVPERLVDAYDSTVDPRHDWGYRVTVADDRTFAYPRGRVVGGSSRVNNCIAIRGAPADYDAWGFDEWSWVRLRPCFERLESGPVPLARWSDDELLPTQRAFREACLAAGFAEVADHNDPHAPAGVGSIPMNRRGRARISTAEAYLEPARDRPNLTVRGDSLVAKVLLDGTRAVGVEVDGTEVLADQVILCAGVVQSPLVLARSGIGPASQLEALAIPCVVDVPEVGSNYQDHPGAMVLALPRDGVCDPGDPILQLVLRWGDLQAYFVNWMDVATNPDLESIAGGRSLIVALFCALQRPVARGRVEIVSREPAAAPHIEWPFLDCSEDVQQLMAGVRVLWSLADSSGLRDLLDAVLLDGSVVDDDTALEAFVRGSCMTLYHGVGTCAMGSVVDARCRVVGVDGLWIVDASIIPTIPGANTNLTCLAIAERAAEMLRHPSVRDALG